MPQLIIPGAMQVSLHFTVSNQEIVNVLGFKTEGIVSVQEAAEKVHTAFTATGGPNALLPTVLKLERVKAVALGAPDSLVYEHMSNTSGGAAGTLGSLATTAVVRVGAGSRSRSGKGRVYFGPLATTNVSADGRTLTPAYVTAVNTNFTKFMNDLKAGGLIWSVLSRKLSIATEIRSISCASVIGTQRRRLR